MANTEAAHLLSGFESSQLSESFLCLNSQSLWMKYRRKRERIPWSHGRGPLVGVEALNSPTNSKLSSSSSSSRNPTKQFSPPTPNFRCLKPMFLHFCTCGDEKIDSDNHRQGGVRAGTRYCTRLQQSRVVPFHCRLGGVTDGMEGLLPFCRNNCERLSFSARCPLLIPWFR
jgi:hypothetical protein